MWGNKKSHRPQAADPEPKNWQTNQPPKRTPATWEGTTKMNKDVMRPAVATADRATARLGSSLHVKGQISGNEDLYIDGTVEGLVQLDERKLTVGATAKLTADITQGAYFGYMSILAAAVTRYAHPDLETIPRNPKNGGSAKGRKSEKRSSTNRHSSCQPSSVRAGHQYSHKQWP